MSVDHTSKFVIVADVVIRHSYSLQESIPNGRFLVIVVLQQAFRRSLRVQNDSASWCWFRMALTIFVSKLTQGTPFATIVDVVVVIVIVLQ
jgi:hypothetical protein